MTKQINFLKRRRKLLIDTLNELIEDKIYTELGLATELGVGRHRIQAIRKGTAVTEPKEVESLLTLLKIK